jgi:hypothetical protein
VLTADWVRLSALAAAAKEPCSSIAASALNCRIEMAAS